MLPLSIGLATLALLLGYGLAGLWPWMLPILAFGAFWLLGQARRWSWMSALGLIFYAATAAVGLLQRVEVSWMLSGLIPALVAWDLDGLAQRIESVQRVDGLDDLERHHLLRLALAVALGLFFTVAALSVRLELGFGVVVLLALLAILGLSRAIGALK
jgi:hypothetical protein